MKFRMLLAVARANLTLEATSTPQTETVTEDGAKGVSFPPDGYIAKMMRKGLPKSEMIKAARVRLEELKSKNVRLQADVMLNRISTEEAEKQMNELLSDAMEIMTFVKDAEYDDAVEEDPELDALLAKGIALAQKAMEPGVSLEELEACDAQVTALELELSVMIMKKRGIVYDGGLMDLVRLKMPAFEM